MRRQVLMELHIPELASEFFILEMPSYHDKGWYIQTTSFSWFRDRELKRAFPDVSGKLIKGMNWMQYAKSLKYTSEHTLLPSVNIAEHLELYGIDINSVRVCKGVWDFYDAIGYDRKRKKYI